MRRIASQAWAMSVMMAGFVLLGCTGPKQMIKPNPAVEEFNPPPNEMRYNAPPESGYMQRPKEKDLAATPNSGNGASMMDTGGMGTPVTVR